MLGSLLLVAQVPVPTLHVANPAPSAQECVLTASFPLPRQLATRSLIGLRIGDTHAAWVPLLRWPDGSLALVQLQWHARLEAREARRVVVMFTPSGDEATTARAAGDQDAWPVNLPLRTEVVDPWGRVYTARLQATSDERRGWVRQKRYGASHVGDAGAVLFDVSIELTYREGEPVGEMTVVLDNGRFGQTPPLGPTRFSRFALVSEHPRLRFRPRYAAENLLSPPAIEHDADGSVRGYRQDLLGPSGLLYLGDATAKALRFDVCIDDGMADDRLAGVRTLVDEPPMAIADLEWVRFTGAFGLHGGPAPVVSQVDERAPRSLAWQGNARFGPFGGFGDALDAMAFGSLGHGPCELHNVVRSRAPELMANAEARVLQSVLRPPPGHRPRLPDATAALRAGLSDRAIAQPHGFACADYEHVTVDLLFDWYWLTGDRFARDELRRQGQAIRGLLQRLPYQTSRGEGCCARALAAVAWATDDAELLAWTVRRLHENVLPRLAESALVALAQPPHPEVLGGDAWFDAPWQMAMLVHGLHALHRLTADDSLAAAAIEVARRMATQGWLEGVGPKYFLDGRDPARFCMPRDSAPLQGTAWFTIGAFVLASELARDRADLQALFAQRARSILLAARDADGMFAPSVRANPWLQVGLDRQERGF